MVFTINLQTYPKEAVLKAVNLFLDRVYVFLDQPNEREIIVSFKPKKPDLGTEKIKDEFYNELLNQLLRQKVVAQNQKIRELIVSATLMNALPNQVEDVLKEVDEENWQSDPLNIKETKD